MSERDISILTGIAVGEIQEAMDSIKQGKCLTGNVLLDLEYEDYFDYE